MLRRSFYIFCFLIFSILCGFAQEKGTTPNELDKNYVPPKSSVFNTDANASSSSSSFSEIKNAIKFNPFFLIRQTTALFYEKWILPDFSVQAGLGYTFYTDPLQTILSQGEFEYSDYKSSLSIGQILQHSEHTGDKKIFASLALRIYWDSYYRENVSYFEIGGRAYNFEVLMNRNYLYPDHPRPPAPGTVTIKNQVLHLIYGYQFNTSGKIKTTHDFYTGFGLRSTTYNIFKRKDYIYTNSFGYEESRIHYTQTKDRETSLTPMLMLGYAFGIGF